MRPIVLAFVCSAMLAGCNDAPKESRNQPDRAVAIESREPVAWLRITDRIDPAVWLASKARRHELSPIDPAVEDIRETLTRSRAHFLESERMLANRTAQLAEMLAADGRPEEFAALLEALSSVAKTAGDKQTFGLLCQHYYNLRHIGIGRNEALAMLSDRYGLQRHR